MEGCVLALTFGLPRDLLNFYTGPGDIFLHLPSLVEPPTEVLEKKDLNFFFYKLILFLLISNIIKLMLLILRSMSLGILS